MKFLFAITVISLCLSGCDRYAFTINEQPVFEPTPLFSDHRLVDPALAVCVEQIISDQKITSPVQLHQLSCTHAGVSNLDGLTIFTDLQQLNLSGNSLNDIKPLLFLPYLVTVDLSDNPSINCKDAALLAKHLSGTLKLPQHCQPK